MGARIDDLYFGLALANNQQPIGRQALVYLSLSPGPVDREALDARGAAKTEVKAGIVAVSYTHLTLPTKA